MKYKHETASPDRNKIVHTVKSLLTLAGFKTILAMHQHVMPHTLGLFVWSIEQSDKGSCPPSGFSTSSLSCIVAQKACSAAMYAQMRVHSAIGNW